MLEEREQQVEEGVLTICTHKRAALVWGGGGGGGGGPKGRENTEENKAERGSASAKELD